jgi:hypothetical protein
MNLKNQFMHTGRYRQDQSAMSLNLLLAYDSTSRPRLCIREIEGEVYAVWLNAEDESIAGGLE